MSKKGHGGGGVGHSAPLWFISWADMCTLMLGFFIMLYAFSNTDSAKYKQMAEVVMASFGFSPNSSPIPLEASSLEKMRAQAIKSFKGQLGDTNDDGTEGSRTAVRTIRDGLAFTIGGTVSFEEGKADLLPAVHDDLLKIARTISGYNYKIEITGHTSKAKLPADSPFKDHTDLSYARAKAVSEFLVSKGGIREERIRLTAAGSYEPLVSPAYDPPKWAKNSRVEIKVTESLVQEYQGDGKAKTAPSAAGAADSEGASD